MAKKNGTKLFDSNIDGTLYCIRATAHALMQMEKRQISTSLIKKTMSQLEAKLIRDLQSIKRFVAIVNRNDTATFVIGFYGNNIIIITVINTNKYYAKNGTLIVAV